MNLDKKSTFYFHLTPTSFGDISTELTVNIFRHNNILVDLTIIILLAEFDEILLKGCSRKEVFLKSASYFFFFNFKDGWTALH